MRIAVLDDYQDVALSCADWGSLPGQPEITVFSEHITRHEALATALRPFDVIVAMRERTPFGAGLLSLLPDLRLLVTTGMANASIDLAAARDRGVAVCGTGGSMTATPELTWGLILALVRRIPAEDQRMRSAGGAGGAAMGTRGGWQQTVGTGLHGKRLGIAGLGRIGQKVAEYGRAFGMQVSAWSQNLDPEHARQAGAEPVSKEQLFSRSDVVTVHYKLSERSTGLVGAAELALMKPAAYLVNTSRGPLVDGAARREDRRGRARRVRYRAAAAGRRAAPRAEYGAHAASRLRHRRHVPGVLRRGGRGHRGLRQGHPDPRAQRLTVPEPPGPGRAAADFPFSTLVFRAYCRKSVPIMKRPDCAAREAPHPSYQPHVWAHSRLDGADIRTWAAFSANTTENAPQERRRELGGPGEGLFFIVFQPVWLTLARLTC